VLSTFVDERESRQGLASPVAAHPPGPSPDASVVVPVNAQGDMPHAAQLLADLNRYNGTHELEILFVVNNFTESQPPAGIEDLERMGARVIAIPSIRREGYSVGITARVLGLRQASAESALLFDADCRIPEPTPLVDWYVGTLEAGATAAYTPVGHFELPPGLDIRIRLRLHHAARWAKRRLLRVPTLRGSNYAVRRTQFLALFDDNQIVHDMNVGPAVKAAGGRIAYSGRRELTVLTSGRFLRPGWVRLLRYIRNRLRHNVRTMRGRR
jgi:hypothetical protein